MTSAAAPASATSGPPLVGIRTLHLFTLCCFAITQPILVALAGQPVYLRDQQIGWLEIGVLLTFLLLILPVGILTLDRAVLRFSASSRGYGRNTIFAILFMLILCSLIRPYIGIHWLAHEGLTGLVAFTIVTPCTWMLILIYDRVNWLRTWLTFSSIGLIVFPSMFLWQFYTILRDEKTIEQHVVAKNTVPVIFIVFDEFSGTTLMNERLEINSRQFPNFARLAEQSTWYRKMTTVHPRTGTAVPAVLSGRFPVTDRPPVASEYPGNLLQVIESSKQFEMAVFEPATRICPASLRKLPEPIRPLTQKIVDLIHTMAAVYPRLIFTHDAPVYFPAIPVAWFGINHNTTSGSSKFAELTEGLFSYSYTQQRDQQLQHFLRCLLPSDHPRFCFLHAVIPHFPWCFLPNGEKYQSDFFNSSSPPTALGELGEDWQSDPTLTIRNEYRYRLQVKYVDNFIGQVLDRLEETGILERCLLIVTADHGVAFRPGHSRRQPDADNLAEILSVPLFIKLPGQTEGQIDNRNVETVDLLPTVAEILGIDLPEPVDGIAVSSQTRRPRKTIYFEKTMTVVEPDFPQLPSAINRQVAVFGNESLENMPAKAASRFEWHGRPITEFAIDNRPTPFNSLAPLATEFSKDVTISPCFICGQLNNADIPDGCTEIVIAVDGVIRDTSKLGWTAPTQKYFEFLLPQYFLSGNSPQISLYLVEEQKNGVVLRPLQPAF